MDEDESDDENIYEVEKILRHKIRKGVTYYYLKWNGYPDSENTWEAASNVEATARTLVERYWKEWEQKKADPSQTPTVSEGKSRTEWAPKWVIPSPPWSKHNWEDSVLSVDTVVKDQTGALMVYLKW
ncbi:uncharacterized protein VTP21DRAFT_5277 [Calcarisporiella thermophila]|uniref:uncharacterized protein n=1 Tax=Calcarisporiella thermophila TaxID=911321 RepID=UPI003743F46B